MNVTQPKALTWLISLRNNTGDPKNEISCLKYGLPMDNV